MGRKKWRSRYLTCISVSILCLPFTFSLTDSFCDFVQKVLFVSDRTDLIVPEDILNKKWRQV